MRILRDARWNNEKNDERENAQEENVNERERVVSMNKSVFAFLFLFLIPLVSADCGMMGWMYTQYGWMGGAAFGIFGIICMIVATFVFSAIFWITYKWIIKPKEMRK